MTHCRLLLVGHLAERFSVWRIEENRIVSKAVIAHGLWCELSFDYGFGFEDDVRPLRQREGRHEPCIAGSHSPLLQLRVDRVEPLDVRRIGPKIASRVNAGLTVE